MKKTSLIVHQNYIEDVITTLHKTGMMEIIDISKEEPETLEITEKASMDPEAGTCATYELRVSRVIGILKKVQPKRQGIKAFLHPQLPEIKTIEEGSLEEIYSYTEGVLGEIEKTILKYEQRLNELDEQKEQIKLYLEHLDYLKDFELDLADIGESDYVIVKVGKTSHLYDLEENIKQKNHATIFSKPFGSGKKIEWVVVVAAHITEKEFIEKLCREKITEFDFGELTGSPKDVLESLKEEETSIKKEREKIVSNLRKFAEKQLSDLLAIREEIKLEKLRKEVSKNFAKTNSTYVINGWVLEKNETALKDAVIDISKDNIICEFSKPSANPDNPPTHIETPRWAEGFRGLLEMFATPKYNEINPAIIMGLFFVLFFGIMLGDAGYGLVILILSLFGYFKFGKYSDMIRNWSFMGFWMGLVTTVVGFLTNGFFGDLIPRFFYGDPTAYLYGPINLPGVQLPVHSIKDPISILVIALIFGLIHLNVGILLGMIQTFKAKKYKELITSRLCWIPLQVGGGMLVGHSILDFQLSETFVYIAAFLVIIGLIQLFLSAGPIGFFDITGYVGDWLSYARLLALGLATAGMALAFNVVAQLLGDMIPVIGIVIMIIILIIAHIVNLGLQTLGAGIHSLRLQYVEFFNRFYEGGGHKFAPFKINRKYTKIEEEKID